MVPTRRRQESPDANARHRSVVQILTSADPPDYDQPWQTRGVESASGSGAIIETPRGLRVLTSAHVVEHAVFVEVRRDGRAEKFVATVECAGYECDLALLKVEKAEFFRDAEPIAIGGLPALGDRVSVLGFPIGGERMSLTQGVVSRIEVTPYAQSERRLLAVQIDAAINEGNSGGPVLDGDSLVGIAFQALEQAESVGYMIPTPVVEHFLREAGEGDLEGFPSLGITTQPLASDALRRYLGVPKRRAGVLVTTVEFGGAAAGVLEPGDVLLGVGRAAVAADGTVGLRDEPRIAFDQQVASRRMGERMRVRAWRDGAPFEADVTLAPLPRLVPRTLGVGRPSFFVFGGLLFVPVTRGYLRTWGDDWMSEAPTDLVTLYESGVRTERMQEIVVLQKVLADEVNRGYHGMRDLRIVKCQDRRVRSLADLVRRVDRSREEFIRFETADGRSVVLDRAQAVERLPQVLERYGLPEDRSTDLPRPAPGPTGRRRGGL